MASILTTPPLQSHYMWKPIYLFIQHLKTELWYNLFILKVLIIELIWREPISELTAIHPEVTDNTKPASERPLFFYLYLSIYLFSVWYLSIIIRMVVLSWPPLIESQHDLYIFYKSLVFTGTPPPLRINAISTFPSFYIKSYVII